MCRNDHFLTFRWKLDNENGKEYSQLQRFPCISSKFTRFFVFRPKLFGNSSLITANFTIYDWTYESCMDLNEFHFEMNWNTDPYLPYLCNAFKSKIHISCTHLHTSWYHCFYLYFVLNVLFVGYSLKLIWMR